jgi:hypothetical protein
MSLAERRQPAQLQPAADRVRRRRVGQLKGGRHLQFPKDTRMSNLLLAMLGKLGVRAETFGDSTGMLDI